MPRRGGEGGAFEFNHFQSVPPTGCCCEILPCVGPLGLSEPAYIKCMS